jgi:uncharacterized protein
MGEWPEYDRRYLAGIQFFNHHDFFEAHEAWEELWLDCSPEDRRFYQGLIQAAVALHHWHNGNWRGTQRLFHSGRRYMSTYPGSFLGLRIGRFWQEMERAVAEALNEAPDGRARLDLTMAPTIELDPPPAQWPEVPTCESPTGTDEPLDQQ